MQLIPEVTTGLYHGLEAWQVQTASATAVISVFGGQLLSYVPAGQPDLLWLSPTRAALPTPIRGGVPICWPWFGRQGQPADAPAHGRVRTARWQLQQASRLPDGDVELELVPVRADAAALRLSMQLRIGARLHQQLHSHNTGADPVTLTQALHSYFRVGDATRVEVDGVDGLHYLDKYEDYAQPRLQQGPWHLRDPRDPGRSDRIYPGTSGHYVLRDPVLQRRIDIHSEGSHTLVAWNPGAEAAAQMADVGEGWHDYVCLEVANAGPDVIELAPGASHRMDQILSSSAL
ncbi:D-hexose-6-phosphate mutarotase [Stenotrophomonas sp. 24(2023)]|uniref:D-hexose-6-phosphate mutarotase n=1 Tax=Stenotrophomonas sp. 24(2023) TaxID=3068324 RepID=UPI0027DFF97D|nr:D-hexose-6-phosphate mutarotase [Stenotrophomonas sp. 24(2023)]WMJ71028.1 D-hexose-6-phosphate mutarotase [Stenotrophomonas sp. 24(2023)]